MFKISRRMDYAVRIMIQLGQAGMEERMMSEDLAKAAGVPEAFLRKIILDLSKAHLIHTFAGPNGGIALAREPATISINDIYTAVEGPVCLNICLLEPELCALSSYCGGLDFWEQLQATIVRELQATSLATLVEQTLALQKNPRCNIHMKGHKDE